MSFYAKLIIEATGCKKDEASEIEDVMRGQRNALDGLTKAEFTKLAKVAYAAWKQIA